jgi:general secretion pathway protein A
VIGNGDKQSGLNSKEDNFMAAFNKEPGRHDR